MLREPAAWLRGTKSWSRKKFDWTTYEKTTPLGKESPALRADILGDDRRVLEQVANLTVNELFLRIYIPKINSLLYAASNSARKIPTIT